MLKNNEKLEDLEKMIDSVLNSGIKLSMSIDSSLCDSDSEDLIEDVFDEPPVE